MLIATAIAVDILLFFSPKRYIRQRYAILIEILRYDIAALMARCRHAAAAFIDAAAAIDVASRRDAATIRRRDVIA